MPGRPGARERGSARSSRAQGTAVAPRRELLHVHQEQGLRRCGDAGPGRRGALPWARPPRARPPRRVAAAASTSSTVTSARTTSRASCSTCCVRARRSASRSSCSAQSNSDPAEDFTITQQGLVSDFFTAGLVSAAVDLHYGGSAAFPRAPPFLAARAPRLTRTSTRTRSSTRRSAWTAACASASAAPRWPAPRSPWSRVASRPRRCGSRTGATRRVASRGNSTVISSFYVPLINGSDTNFSQPFVLTYPSSGYPTDKPRPQLYTTNLTGFSPGLLVQPDRCEQQPAVGRGLRRPPVGSAESQLLVTQVASALQGVGATAMSGAGRSGSALP